MQKRWTIMMESVHWSFGTCSDDIFFLRLINYADNTTKLLIYFSSCLGSLHATCNISMNGFQFAHSSVHQNLQSRKNVYANPVWSHCGTLSQCSRSRSRLLVYRHDTADEQPRSSLPAGGWSNIEASLQIGCCISQLYWWRKSSQLSWPCRKAVFVPTFL